jgi:hypothetical protein
MGNRFARNNLSPGVALALAALPFGDPAVQGLHWRHRWQDASGSGYGGGGGASPWAYWSPGGGYPQAVPAPPAEPPRPQVIAIRTDDGGRSTSAVASDYGYVAGCHATAYGYHCDTE